MLVLGRFPQADGGTAPVDLAGPRTAESTSGGAPPVSRRVADALAGESVWEVVGRLVSLPGDRAVYRIRWQVWSGWHLLWSVEPLADNDSGAARRIALRTGATPI